MSIPIKIWFDDGFVLKQKNVLMQLKHQDIHLKFNLLIFNTG
jgi:hypothetical protein